MAKFGTGKNDSFYNQDLRVDLMLANATVKTCEIGYFAIWSEKSKLIITKIRIPREVFYDVSKKRIFPILSVF